MAMLTPAQKPRGLARMTFIRDAFLVAQASRLWECEACLQINRPAPGTTTPPARPGPEGWRRGSRAARPRRQSSLTPSFDGVMYSWSPVSFFLLTTPLTVPVLLPEHWWYDSSLPLSRIT